MNNTVLHFAGVALLSLFIGFFIGRAFTNSTANASNVSSSKITAAKTANAETSTSDTAAISDTAGVVKKPSVTATDPLVTEIKPVTSNNKDVLPLIATGVSDNKISQILTDVAVNMEQKKLVYDSKLKQDCSGIFHQLKDSLQTRLPNLKQKSKYKYPSFRDDRSSRQIADWYYKNDNLLIIQDPIAARNSIRPGAVMFYGKSNKKFNNLTIDNLTDRNNNYTSNGYIMHIAVVTSVRTDAEGNVVDYTIMHGRNKRHPASRSGSKEIQSKNKKLPPFGNWSQQWVAVANMVTAQ